MGAAREEAVCFLVADRLRQDPPPRCGLGGAAGHSYAADVRGLGVFRRARRSPRMERVVRPVRRRSELVRRGSCDAGGGVEAHSGRSGEEEDDREPAQDEQDVRRTAPEAAQNEKTAENRDPVDG